jgi:hypothetical protein
MSFIDKAEGWFFRQRWIDAIPETIVAVISGPVSCSPAQTMQYGSPTTNSQETDIMGGDNCGVYEPAPAWIMNPGDGYIVAESECNADNLCEHAEMMLQPFTISRLLKSKCGVHASTSTDGQRTETHETASGRIMGIHDRYVGYCQLPNGEKGLKLYLKIVTPGVICNDALSE